MALKLYVLQGAATVYLGAPTNDPFSAAERPKYRNFDDCRTFTLPKPINAAAEAFFTSGTRTKWCLTRDGSTPVIVNDENRIGADISTSPVIEFFGFVGNLTERRTESGPQVVLTVDVGLDSRG